MKKQDQVSCENNREYIEITFLIHSKEATSSIARLVDNTYQEPQQQFHLLPQDIQLRFRARMSRGAILQLQNLIFLVEEVVRGSCPEHLRLDTYSRTSALLALKQF